MTTAYTEKDYKSRRFNMRALFDSFAEGAVRDFPQLKNKFALYSAPTNSWHTDLEIRNNRRVKQNLKEAIKDKDMYTAFAWRLDDLYLMSWVTDPGLKYIDLSYTFFVLQHELGHLVVPAAARTTGNHESNFRECAADIFSLTRIEQLYHGINADTKRQDKIKTRSSNFIFKKLSTHFTAPVIERLIDFAKDHDLTTLTPVQTANFAYRMALRYALPEQTLNKLVEIFFPASQLFQETEDLELRKDMIEKTLKKTAEIMLQDYGEMTPLVYAIGKKTLDDYLKQSTLYSGVKFIPPQDDFWNDIRQKIKERDAQTAKETPQQAFLRKVDHLQVLGYFDREKDQNNIIDSRDYESAENQAYIKAGRENYIKRHRPGRAAKIMSFLRIKRG